MAVTRARAPAGVDAVGLELSEECAAVDVIAHLGDQPDGRVARAAQP